MTEELDPRQGLTRRETLRRGAAMGGALLWAVPTVQSLSMTAAKAQTTSPRPSEGPDISFIGLNVSCTEGPVTTAWVIKYEGCSGDDCFEGDPGKFPLCSQFTPVGEKTDGDDLGFEVEGPHPVTRCVDITVPAGCTVTASAIKGGQLCCTGATGTGKLTFCPPNC